jgi:NAD-dependent deacetylase
MGERQIFPMQTNRTETTLNSYLCTDHKRVTYRVITAKERILVLPKNIVVLTGAGVSAESGVATFRDNGGLWEQHRIEDVATPEAFMRDPDMVQKFYNMRRAQLHNVSPNAAHHALADLEARHDGSFLLVTQNVDDLHERAGSKNVIHMHGELKKIRCEVCGAVHEWFTDCDQATPCPTCKSAPSLRPHIVWFGEMPFYMEKIYVALKLCDLFLSIGTSGNVYPASGFVAEVADIGRARTVEVNLEPSMGVSLFDEAYQGKAGEVLPNFVNQLFEKKE